MTRPTAWLATLVVVAFATVAHAGPNEIRTVTTEQEGGATRVIVKSTQTPTFTVYKLERPTRVVRCPGMRAHADMFDEAPVSLRIPRRCIGDPKRVRVAARFEDETTASVDWAPERRTFTPWVAR